MEEIREDEIWECVEVTLELLRGLDNFKVLLSRWLRFNIANDMLLAVPHPKIRIPGFSLFRQRGDMALRFPCRFGEGFKEIRKSRIIALLAGVALLCYFKYPL